MFTCVRAASRSPRGIPPARQFATGILSPETARAVEGDAIEAKAAGVEWAPVLFLNGTKLPGEFTCDAIVKALGLRPGGARRSLRGGPPRLPDPRRVDRRHQHG